MIFIYILLKIYVLITKEYLIIVKKMKENGSIEKLWTYNGIVYFKYKDSRRENPKKLYRYEDLYDYFSDDDYDDY